MTLPRVALFTRFPTPGVTKTRLIPVIGAERAAALHRRLVEDTIATVKASTLPFEVWITGASMAAFAGWLGDVPLVEQAEGDLGARLARVTAPAILIGGDAPGLKPAHLSEAAAALETHAAVIGPALDGGYYLLGYREPIPFAFADMPWGTDAVLGETARRFAERGVEVARLGPLADIDRPEDLAAWPELLA